MTTNAPTLNLQFTYSQLLALAMQLDDEDRFRLCRELTRGLRSESLKAIREAFRTDELDEETIIAECEAVRQKMYEEQSAR
ncbi:MAG: hypothetical protein MJZ97_11635 [Bacteroidales bacterium]|nr:hypothetical protein [Bacteroidales bacterium]